jgi:AcrR family transcriptional regulator
MTMTTPSPAAPLSKCRSAVDTRREAILDVATQVFLEEGFAAASMSTIAARLGGSKGTLYNYFKSKDELFEAYVQRRCALTQDGIQSEGRPGETIAEALTRIGRSYCRIVLSDENLRHFRLICAEAERSPEFGKAFYEAGPGKGHRRMADQLRTWAEEGRLKLDDPWLAAQQFLALCQNRWFKARLANYMPAPTEEDIAAEVKGAVDTFLRAFGAGADLADSARR